MTNRVAVITRVKLHRRVGRFAWQWLYSVSIDSAQPVAIGTSLAGARAWAKSHGAIRITEVQS